MPVFRYFLYVGAALIAMFFVIDAYAPKPEAPMQANAPGFDHTTIRITSNRVAEDPIIYDTSQPTIVPPPTQLAETKPVERTDASATKDARVEAMAQIDTSPKPAASKSKPKPRKIARHEYPRQRYAQRQTAWAQPSFFPNFFGSW
ncbi:hypothetical protein V1291_004576 [Nitrobacteraceae bacterium AZCC 1564]